MGEFEQKTSPRRDIDIDFDAKDKSLCWLQEMKRKGLPFVLFGCSGAVSFILDTLKDNHIIPKYICDNDPEKQGGNVDNIPVISLEELAYKKEQCVYLVTAYKPQFIREIYSKIDSKGGGAERKFQEMFYPLGKDSSEFIRTNYEKINQVYHLLEDSKSRHVYEAKMNYLISKDELLLDGIWDKDQYFDKDVIGISSEECLIDAGAFDGQDTFRLMDCCPELKAFCIELDAFNYTKMKSRLRNYQNIKCIHAGVYHQNCVKNIRVTHGMGTSVHNEDICGHGNVISTEMITIDDYFKNENVTLIKMDVEGSEKDALMGARETIRNKMPKLAICIYHSMEDHWEIPLLIHQMQPQYQIYIRHYHPYGIETVCYAIPKGR